MYSDEEIEDELSRVDRQLNNMNPNIPSGWRLMAVDATTVTQSNLQVKLTFNKSAVIPAGPCQNF